MNTFMVGSDAVIKYAKDDRDLETLVADMRQFPIVDFSGSFSANFVADMRTFDALLMGMTPRAKPGSRKAKRLARRGY